METHNGLHQHLEHLRETAANVQAGFAGLYARGYAWGYDAGFRKISPHLRGFLGLECPWCGDRRVVVQKDCLLCASCHRVLAVAERMDGRRSAR